MFSLARWPLYQPVRNYFLLTFFFYLTTLWLEKKNLVGTVGYRIQAWPEYYGEETKLHGPACVVISIQPQDDSLGSKRVAINTTNNIVLPRFTALIIRKRNGMFGSKKEEQMYNIEMQNLRYKKSNSILVTCLWIKNSAGIVRAQK